MPGGLIPFRHTIFLWQNIVALLAEVIAVTAVMWLATPPRQHSRTRPRPGGRSHRGGRRAWRRRPREDAWSLARALSGSRSWLVVALGVTYLVRYFIEVGQVLNAINLNTMNLAFLLAGFLLHRTPARLMHAVQDATPAVWGVILQFPFYAGIAGIVTTTHPERQAGGGVRQRVDAHDVPADRRHLFPRSLASSSPLVARKWVIEAPYLMQAAHSLKVNLGWVVNAYGLGEALANLVQPFFMLPILSLLRLSARDVMGYTLIVFLTLTPIVLGLVLLLGETLPYPL